MDDALGQDEPSACAVESDDPRNSLYSVVCARLELSSGGAARTPLRRTSRENSIKQGGGAARTPTIVCCALIAGAQLRRRRPTRGSGLLRDGQDGDCLDSGGTPGSGACQAEASNVDTRSTCIQQSAKAAHQLVMPASMLNTARVAPHSSLPSKHLKSSLFVPHSWVPSFPIAISVDGGDDGCPQGQHANPITNPITNPSTITNPITNPITITNPVGDGWSGEAWSGSCEYRSVGEYRSRLRLGHGRKRGGPCFMLKALVAIYGLGVRIGEASNPGPCSSLDDHEVDMCHFVDSDGDEAAEHLHSCLWYSSCNTAAGGTLIGRVFDDPEGDPGQQDDDVAFEVAWQQPDDEIYAHVDPALELFDNEAAGTSANPTAAHSCEPWPELVGIWTGDVGLSDEHIPAWRQAEAAVGLSSKASTNTRKRCNAAETQGPPDVEHVIDGHIPATSFRGRVEGMVFQLGSLGLGYIAMAPRRRRVARR